MAVGSGKDAMDKPARRAVMAVQTRSEQPEAPPLLVLDPVIVADCISRGGPLRPPPLLGDPLRPVGPRDPIPAPPPREAERRVVGQQPERFDRLRRVEQPDWPWGPHFVIPADPRDGPQGPAVRGGIQGSGPR